MKCLYCAVDLAPLRALADGEFCCDLHRRAYQEEQQLSGRPPEEPSTPGLVPLEWFLHAVPEQNRAGENPAVPLPCRTGVLLPRHAPAVSEALVRACEQLVPLTLPAAPAPSEHRHSAVVNEVFDLKPQFPNWNARPEEVCWYDLGAARPAPGPVPDPAPPRPPDTPRPVQMAAVWKSVTQVWRHSPADLKLLTLVLPVLVILAFTPSLPKVRVGITPDGSLQRVFSGQLDSFRQQIVNRAAVDFTDDFRSGLDDWQSRESAAADWSYDATGFVRPAALALFRPSLTLSDYRFEFLGEIDQRGMGCAFRAIDTNNYYAVKLVIVKPGPLPLVRLVRYAVIDGKEGPRQERPLPVLTRTDTVYRMLVDVRGEDFTIMAQGQVVDFWTDARLKKGGVGLFCARGEKARVRWVEVTHQYDALGRLCAYLAPYGGPGRSGNWN